MTIERHSTLNKIISLDSCPKEVREKILVLKFLREREDFHPEDCCYDHVSIVLERCKLLDDQDMILTALFHDIEKWSCCKYNEKNGYPTAPDHDKQGMITALAHADWIRSLGADPHNVAWLCQQHMRVKLIDEMRKKKRLKLTQHPLWHKLRAFAYCDDMLVDFREEELFRLYS